jgi:hypothetical protein
LYACAPQDVTNGTDPRIHTSMVTGRLSVIATGTASRNATLPVPMGNSGNRLGVATVFQHITLLGKAVHAIALPSGATGECCSGICCKAGESCARSSTGPKCWPGAGAKIAQAESPGNEVHTNGQGNENMLVVRKSALTSSQTCRTTGCPDDEICVNSSGGPTCWSKDFHSSVPK